MPIRKTSLLTAGNVVASPWVGPMDHPISIAVPISGLTTAEIDDNGYLKPGVPLLRTGALVTAGKVFGCVIEATKVAASNSSADRTAAGTVEVTVGLIGTINRKVLEDILGRTLTAPEIAGFVDMPIRLLA
jgi:hypothetical protein